MSGDPRDPRVPPDDRQEIHVHVDSGGRRGDDYPPREDEEAAVAASAMSAQLIWIILVVVLVVAVVLVFTTGVIDFGGAGDVVDDIVPTPAT
ncbi:hypothetical protein BH23CHL1_BH23CHL1_06700 [soil metagenome]